jgi:hypothetical protein
MVGLGILGDRPPNDFQPPLEDGIHLRWAFRRALGFPWYGFYLFRRRHREGNIFRYLSLALREFKVGPLPQNKLNTAIGELSSDQKLVLSDDFPPPGAAELDLAERDYLRLTLPAGVLARKVRAKIGFKGGNFLQVGIGPNPRWEPGVKLTAWDRPDAPAPNTTVEVINGNPGLRTESRLEIALTHASPLVELRLTGIRDRQTAPAVIEAFREDGTSAGVAVMLANGQVEVFRWQNRRRPIKRLEVRPQERRRHRTCLHQIAFGTEIQMRALVGNRPVAAVQVAGRSGQTKWATLECDTIEGVEFSSGPATLIDLGYVTVSQDAAEGWETVPGFPYPLCLPVAQADYPCTQAFLVNEAAAEAVAAGRVRYGPPGAWSGNPFHELHGRMVELVQGGPGSTPMAQRSQALAGIPDPPDPNVSQPRMPRQYPLDLILLGALQPAVAQMVGLYWVDQAAVPGVAYDYLIVGDYLGAGKLNVDQVLSLIIKTGLLHFEGYIVFNKQAAPAAPLAAPGNLKVYALPGGTRRAPDGGVVDATNNAGLTWDRGVTAYGTLLPGQAIMYHIWRGSRGAADNPAPPDGSQLLTEGRPTLVGQPRLAPGLTPEYPPDWPPFPLHYIDSGLPDGWYSYQVSGIDIFGRHSACSSPATWYQWAPEPRPRPWYYQLPAGDTPLNPSAVRLLDKIPPPPPTGVEAHALDPADPTVLRDAAFQAWWHDLTAASWYQALSPQDQQNLIGVRITWRWTEAHMRQAPDTREFRLYFHPGTDLPGPDHSWSPTWQERCQVVGYAECVTVTADAAGRPVRLYEVFLPDPAGPVHAGLPLSPSLAQPIVYAHLGVSASDDKDHTPDLRAAGDWGGRPGNEGRLGPPAKVFRVRRTLPPTPVAPPDAERVYATTADYHGHSFYTYRWLPSPHLKAHIFRAMDDAVFKADWSQQPRAALSADDPAVFPPEATEPRWDANKRQQVAGELNQLNNFSQDPAGMAQALAYYRGLSNDGLRVLAGLPGNERAFTQLTVQPLDPDDPAMANRLGPDNPPDFVVDPALRCYADTLDGRSRNRYFYRAAYVDGAHNRGPLSLAGPPVWLPDVVPPRIPVITKILGGDRQITITWNSNRELDLAEYVIYRAESETSARDVRLMTLVRREPAIPVDPDLRPAEVGWTDVGVQNACPFWYRILAVDTAGNSSPPSKAMAATAFRSSPPSPPGWIAAGWNNQGTEVDLQWDLPEEGLEFLVQRRTEESASWRAVSAWLPRDTGAFIDKDAAPDRNHYYRIQARDGSGMVSVDYIPRLVLPPGN